MVATRNHPSDFPEPATPTATTKTPSTRARPGAKWTHTPTPLTLIWLAISLPLVAWDTGYVLLRPHTMPGGALHAPLWTPYALYGTVDHAYGVRDWEAGSGWTGAQGLVNLLETVGYGVYLWVVWRFGVEDEGVEGRGFGAGRVWAGRLGEARVVGGRVGGAAVLGGFAVAGVTFWKTVLYWLIEVFSGFDGVGHNDALSLFFLWIVPNGLWLIFPAYMCYIFGQEILQGLEMAATGKKVD